MCSMCKFHFISILIFVQFTKIFWQTILIGILLLKGQITGSKAINDRFIAEGVRIDGVIALGGVAKKSPFVMQIVADVLNMPIKVARSEQACALGSAMAAAVVAGVYPNTAEARKKMGRGIENEYLPIPENVEKYKPLYEQYKKFGKLIEFEY